MNVTAGSATTSKFLLDITRNWYTLKKLHRSMVKHSARMILMKNQERSYA